MKRMMMGLLVMVAAGCATRSSRMYSAAGEVAPSTAVSVRPTAEEMAIAYSGSSVDLENRLEILDSYIGGIEARLPTATPVPTAPLLRTEVILASDTFAGVTDERWSRMEAFWDGQMLQRLRMIPMPGESGTEEFYYHDGRLVFVFYEPDGANKSDSHVESGESFYFGEEGLIVWIKEDGSRVEPGTAAFKYWSEHLKKEGKAFAKAAR